MELPKLEPILRTFTGTYREQKWEVTSALVPAIHLDEHTVSLGEEIATPTRPDDAAETMTDEEIEGRYKRNVEKYGPESADRTRKANYRERAAMKSFGGKRYRFQSLHRRPDGDIPAGFFTKDGPVRPFGRVFASQDVEWEFVVDHIERVLKQNDISEDAPVDQKLTVLANEIWQYHQRGRRIPTQYYSQGFPSDTLALKSHCPGSSAAMVFMCDTLEIPARRVTGTGHSMAEVYLDGSWCFVDNAGTWIKEAGGHPLVKKPYYHMLTHPMDPDLPISELQRYSYWKMMPSGYVFEQPTGVWRMAHKDSDDPIRILSIHLSPQTAQALYPGVEDIWYKSLSENSYVLMEGRPSVYPGSGQLKLLPGAGLCRKFWVGSLANAKSIRGVISGRFPSRGSSEPALGELDGCSVLLNNQEYGVDKGDLEVGTDAIDGWVDWNLSIDVPLDQIAENACNMIGISNANKTAGYLSLKETQNDVIPPEPVHLEKL